MAQTGATIVKLVYAGAEGMTVPIFALLADTSIQDVFAAFETANISVSDVVSAETMQKMIDSWTN